MSSLPGAAPLLAFDTSSRVGSVAVAKEGEVLASATLEHRAEHAARLVPAIEAVLREAGFAGGDVAGVVIGAGPGSFTGVRVAAATAKGLVRGWRVPLWAVSSLAAAAATPGSAPPLRYALFDARSDRVYGACYRVQADRIDTLVEPHGGLLATVLEDRAPEGAAFLGDGADRHRAEIEEAGFHVVAEGIGPTARGLLSALSLQPDPEPVGDVAAWEPTYLRGTTAVPS